MQKNPQTMENIFTFSGFSQIPLELCVPKVQLAPQHGYFINGIANPKIAYTV